MTHTKEKAHRCLGSKCSANFKLVSPSQIIVNFIMDASITCTVHKANSQHLDGLSIGELIHHQYNLLHQQFQLVFYYEYAIFVI
jgi:hypothetical protein